ncbi:MOSC domain-containing protein [Salinigranum marinum]|uniref:MOSC domain-containing protein n=1 Tax=Salinigranum marinum TaxID=1515595 RepID=UPI002989BFC7|nr:MOSC domain-containing protein [Salinigranum marinum]
MGRVEAVFTAPADGEPMDAHESVDAVEGGLRGDRYLFGSGHYSPYDVCEVTFVAGEAIGEIRERYDIDLSDGRHRRNVVTRGVDLRSLLETTFRVGEATFRGTRPRPPCAHVERVAGEDGVARALKEGRGGICADVLEPGAVRVGDEITVVEASPRAVGQEIAERLRGDASE